MQIGANPCAAYETMHIRAKERECASATVTFFEDQGLQCVRARGILASKQAPGPGGSLQTERFGPELIPRAALGTRIFYSLFHKNPRRRRLSRKPG